MQENREPDHGQQPDTIEQQNSDLPNDNFDHKEVEQLLHSGMLSSRETLTGFDHPQWDDIVTPLMPLNYGKNSPLVADLDDPADRLQQERILLLGCYDNTVILHSVQLLLDKLSISRQNRFLINCDRENPRVANLSMEFFLEEELPKDFGCAIDVRPLEGQAFLYSLNELSFPAFRTLRNRLHDLDSCIICMVHPGFMRSRFPSGCNTATYREISFLKPVLQTRFPHNHDELVKKITRQRQNGDWGGNEEEFYRIVSSYLAENRLEEEIAGREKYKGSQGSSSALNIAGAELFPEDDHLLLLKKTVLYVAAFFPGLTPHDFTSTVSLLLGESTAQVPVQETRIREDGSKEKIETFEEQSLLKIWRRNNDAILAENQLTASTGGESVRTIGFTNPYLSNALGRFMEEQFPFFLDEQFTVIKKRGLLFTSSGKMLENVIALSVKMALSNVRHHGRQWLSGMLMQLNHELHTNNDCPGDLHGLLEHILEQMEKDIHGHIIYTRISYLIREMLHHDPLQKMVRDFFEQLINTGDHTGLLEIVKKLRNVPGFDEFFWMQQLLERGRGKVKKETYTLLYRHIINSGQAFPSRMEKLMQWLPEADKPLANYSNANRFALWVIMSFAIDSVAQLQAKARGEHSSLPELFPLLTTTDSGPNPLQLVNWLFHPGISLLFAGDGDKDAPHLLHDRLLMVLYLLLEVDCYTDQLDTLPETSKFLVRTIAGHLVSLQQHPEKSALFLSSALLAQWFILLHNRDNTQRGNTKEAALQKSLLSAVANHTRARPAHHKRLTAYWRGISNDILGIINTVPPEQRNTRRLLSRKRTLLKQLVKTYRNIRKNSKQNNASLHAIS